MDFDQAIQALNSSLKTNQPSTFSGSWVHKHAAKAYRYIWAHVRTELGDIDWDRVVTRLDRELQKRWTPKRPKTVRKYRSIREVRVVLNRYRDKLYVFVSPAADGDKRLRDTISIALVRTAQKGNVRAQQELLKLLGYVVDYWIEHCPKLWRWRGYADSVERKVESCIRRYRHTGSFIGYFFRTLEYAARGLPRLQIYSLKDS